MLRIKQYNNFPIASSVEIQKRRSWQRVRRRRVSASERPRERERKSSIFLFIYLSSSIMHVFVSAAAVREVDFPPQGLERRLPVVATDPTHRPYIITAAATRLLMKAPIWVLIRIKW
jgi:hypothetical protein